MPKSNSTTAPQQKVVAGRRFQSWVLVKFISKIDTTSIWLCRCDCGTEKEVRLVNLYSGRSHSCGCVRRERCREIGRRQRHGMSLSTEYRIWAGMVQRCTHPEDPSYKNYAGRGISIEDPRWFTFDNFFADMGNRPSRKHTLERVDNSKGYSPANCRWATHAEQANNKRTNRLLTFKDRTQTSKQWASELQISYAALRSRLCKGWTTNDALTRPVRLWRAK